MFTRTTWALIASSAMAVNLDSNEEYHVLAEVSAKYNSFAEVASIDDIETDFYSHAHDLPTETRAFSVPKSTEWSTPLQLSFKNKTDEWVELFWHDYQGNLQGGTYIAPFG